MKRIVKKTFITFAFFTVLHTATAQQRDRDFPRGGAGFSVGATQIFPQSNYFASATGIHLDIGLRLNRFYVGFKVGGGSLRLTTPLLSSTTGYDHDFQKGDRLYFEGYMGIIGYTLIRNNWIDIAPLVGLGATSLRSNFYEGERNRDEFTVFNSFTISPGLRVEFPLHRASTSSPYVTNLTSLRFDVGYNMPVRFRYTPARGNVFFVRMGIVLWFGDV